MAAQDAGTSAGILPELDMGDATGIVSEMEAQEAGLWLALDILCVSETNTRFGRAFLLRRLRNQVPANWKDLRVFSFCYCCAAAYSPPCGASFLLRDLSSLRRLLQSWLLQMKTQFLKSWLRWNMTMLLPLLLKWSLMEPQISLHKWRPAGPPFE